MATKARQNKRKMKKISQECWDLEAAFLSWLEIHLKTFLHDADKVVDLNGHSFEYGGKSYTQKEIIVKMIKDLDDLHSIRNIYDSEYIRKEAEVLDLWKLVLRAMWW